MNSLQQTMKRSNELLTKSEISKTVSPPKAAVAVAQSQVQEQAQKQTVAEARGPKGKADEPVRPKDATAAIAKPEPSGKKASKKNRKKNKKQLTQAPSEPPQT